MKIITTKKEKEVVWEKGAAEKSRSVGGRTLSLGLLIGTSVYESPKDKTLFLMNRNSSGGYGSHFLTIPNRKKELKEIIMALMEFEKDAT